MNINEKVITVSGIDVKVIFKDIKNLHISVAPPHGWVRVASPKRLNYEVIRCAVICRLSWIKRQIKSFQEQPRQTKREMVSGEDVYYLGRRYLLDIEYTDAKPFVEIKKKQKIILNVNKGDGKKAREKLLKEWYRKELNLLLPKIIKKWEEKTELKVANYGIRRMKTRWASCKPFYKKIWLNLELIKKPLQQIKYVVVHEMVHFLEPTHSDRFTHFMDKFLPNWKTIKKELNANILAYDEWNN